MMGGLGEIGGLGIWGMGAEAHKLQQNYGKEKRLRMEAREKCKARVEREGWLKGKT